MKELELALGPLESRELEVIYTLGMHNLHIVFLWVKLWGFRERILGERAWRVVALSA